MPGSHPPRGSPQGVCVMLQHWKKMISTET